MFRIISTLPYSFGGSLTKTNKLHIGSQDLAGQIRRLWPMLLSAIQDEVDDVRAVAASCLLPIADKLPNVMPDKVVALSFSSDTE